MEGNLVGGVRRNSPALAEELAGIDYRWRWRFGDNHSFTNRRDLLWSGLMSARLCGCDPVTVVVHIGEEEELTGDSGCSRRRDGGTVKMVGFSKRQS